MPTPKNWILRYAQNDGIREIFGVRADALAVDAADLMEQHRITGVIVVDESGCAIGALNSNDLMRAKVI